MSYTVCETEQKLRDMLMKEYAIEPNDLGTLDEAIDSIEDIQPLTLEHQEDLNDELLRLYRMRREITDPLMLEYKELIFAAYPDWEG